MKFAYRTDHNAKAVAALWGRPIDNKAPYAIKAISDDAAELWVVDVLGWPWNDINAMIREVSSLKAKDLLVRLNSPGGDPIDTFALYHALKNHSAKVTVRIEALAASAASFLALAGSEVQAYPSSLMMIHNSWVAAVGNRFDLQDTADILEKIDTNMQEIYSKRTKKGKKEICSMMDAETWMTAKEMKEQGFIDTILDGKAVKAQFDLSMFANVPDDIDGTKDPAIFTGFDVEKALRDAKAPKGFAKAVAAACRAAKLVDWRQADDEPNAEEDAKKAVEQQEIAAVTAEAQRLLSAMRSN